MIIDVKNSYNNDPALINDKLHCTHGLDKPAPWQTSLTLGEII